MNRYLLVTAMGVAAALLPLTVRAQTCRISCGRSAAGIVTYKEVYEFDYVSQKPEFPGGDSKLVRFINQTRKYPRDAYRRGVQGRVTCSFVVNADGSVSNIQVLRGVEASLNAEAVRILSKMPDWVPGKIDGRAVPVRVTYTVPFRK